MLTFPNESNLSFNLRILSIQRLWFLEIIQINKIKLCFSYCSAINVAIIDLSCLTAFLRLQSKANTFSTNHIKLLQKTNHNITQPVFRH